MKKNKNISKILLMTTIVSCFSSMGVFAASSSGGTSYGVGAGIYSNTTSSTNASQEMSVGASALPKKGWSKSGNSWYFYKNGYRVHGWQKINGKWYYFNPNGTMKTGWLNDGGTWYYLYSDGHMASNTVINGYRLNSSGAWVK